MSHVWRAPYYLAFFICRSLRYSENHFKQVCCYMYISRIWNSQQLLMNNIVVVVVWMCWHLSQFRSSIEGEQRIHPSFVDWICFCSIRGKKQIRSNLLSPYLVRIKTPSNDISIGNCYIGPHQCLGRLYVLPRYSYYPSVATELVLLTVIKDDR